MRTWLVPHWFTMQDKTCDDLDPILSPRGPRLDQDGLAPPLIPSPFFPLAMKPVGPDATLGSAYGLPTVVLRGQSLEDVTASNFSIGLTP